VCHPPPSLFPTAPFMWSNELLLLILPAGLVAGGMTLWMTSFLAVSFLVVPAAVKLYGGSLTDLTAQDRAYFTLATQTAETIVSLGLIRAITNSSSDKYDELKLFQYSFKAPFQKGSGWLAWGLFGALLSPVVVGGTAYLVSAAGYDNLFGGGRGTVDGVVSMINLDLPTYLSLLSVTGFQAPLLEETVFRGFLLTSLTKVMPTWAAVLASAVAFGIAHLSMRDLPVLVALGTWMGFMYVRSKNLLTPMLMHGTWNSFVLTLLFYLTSTGVDVEQLLNEFK
jgi:membrane protease YdiL (CAAX protease family)